MYFVKTLFTLVAAASAVLGAPSQEFAPAAVEKRQNPTYSKNWSNDQANVTYENRAGGVYAVNWLQPNGGNFVVGKGFNPAREVALKYSGTFTLGQESNTYLALYGWVYGPTAEFYVIENFGVHHPADNKNSTCYGYIDSDGGRYEIWMKWQLSNGNPTFRQYWAVRTKRRTGGTITTGNFFKAWEAVGLPLNTKGEMVMGVEGQWGGGSATITVGTGPTATVRETATPTTRTNVATRTGTCTASIDISR
jgi:endo-1,4-beta-xylanase